jgi:hypothetical protein
MIRVNCDNCGQFMWLDTERALFVSAAMSEYESWGDGLICDRCDKPAELLTLDPDAVDIDTPPVSEADDLRNSRPYPF